MPSAEDILNARDSGDESAAVEKDESPRIETDQSEQTPTFEGGEPPPEPGERPDTDEDSKQVPIKALHAEREKTKRYTEEVRDLHAKIAELTQAVLTPKPPPPPPVQPPPPPEFDWDNPIGTIDARTQAQVTELLSRERAAIAAEFQRNREAMQSQFAMQRHGEETVKEAYAALAAARDSDPQWGADYQRIMRSPDQYEAMVAWHKQRKLISEVGTDPEAYKARIRAEYLEELRNGKPMQGEREEAPRQPTAMPSNLSTARSVGSRNGVAWQGPTPIKDIFANR